MAFTPSHLNNKENIIFIDNNNNHNDNSNDSIDFFEFFSDLSYSKNMWSSEKKKKKKPKNRNMGRAAAWVWCGLALLVGCAAGSACRSRRGTLHL